MSFHHYFMIIFFFKVKKFLNEKKENNVTFVKISFHCVDGLEKRTLDCDLIVFLIISIFNPCKTSSLQAS